MANGTPFAVIMLPVPEGNTSSCPGACHEGVEGSGGGTI